MADPAELQPRETAATDQGDLRATLEELRRQAEEEIARLNRKLAEREQAAETRAASATEHIALQQELSTLQSALGIKEQALDRITDECRRLEDQLEDQNVAFDGLKQEVERKETSLKAAREEVERLQHQLAEIREQSLDLSHSTSRPGLLLPPVESTPQTATARPRLGHLAAGLGLGILAIGISVLIPWGGRGIDWSSLTDHKETQPTAPSMADSSRPAAAPTRAPAATTPIAGAPARSRAETQPSTPPTGPLPKLRDRLRDGTQGPTLVRIPGGTFRMGHNSLAGGDSWPEHTVSVPPFLMGAYEVTFEDYDRFARATGRRLPDDYGWGRDDRPAVGVSWSDAGAYADWLSRQTGKYYRLPSEAEWELAARAGSAGSYWWGFGMEPNRAVCFDCGSKWDNRSTAPVGSFGPNPFGLFDTAGNALEWVSDCWAPSYDGAPSDGQPRSEGDCAYRVARGGAYNKPSASIRNYARSRLVPETRIDSVGFRIARDP